MKKILKLTFILLLVSAVVAGVLGLTDMVTKDRIADYNAKKTAEAYGAVMEFNSYEEVEFNNEDSTAKKIFKTDGGNWVVESEVSGSQGMITVAIGVNADLN